MSFTFKKIAVFGVLLGSLFLVGCGDKNTATDNKIKVGVIMGSELNVAEVAKKIAKEKYNLDVELVIFTDYVTPNAALNKGDIDANAFQHKQFLDEQIKTRGYDLVPVGNTFVYPIAAYSQQIKSIDELKEGDTVVIPNDPTNLARSLFLLQKQGLITLKDNVGMLPTILDIKDNPKSLQIMELEAPQLPRAYADKKVALAIINTAYSSQINLIPTRDGLFYEEKDSPYVNIIVARRDNQNSQKVKQYVAAYQTEEVYQAAEKEFKGGAIKGW